MHETRSPRGAEKTSNAPETIAWNKRSSFIQNLKDLLAVTGAKNCGADGHHEWRNN